MTSITLADQVSVLQERIISLEKELSDQEQVQDALLLSEKNLSAILEQNADGILIVDTEGIVMYVNPAAEMLFNKNKNEFLGSLFGFPVSTDRQDCSFVIMTGEEFREVEFHVVQVQWQLKPAFQLSIRDITRIKQTEEELRRTKDKVEESETKFRELFSRVGDAIFAYDPDSYEIIEANRATSEIYGYSHDELIGMSCLEFSAEVEKSKSVANSIKNEKKISVKVRHHKKKDGTDVFVELVTYNIFVYGKNIIYGVCHDITDIKKKEFDLIKTKEEIEEIAGRLEAALESMSDAVFISDMEGKFINFNKAFATFHKFKTISECANTLKEYPEFLDVFYLNGEFVPLEMWVVSKALRGETGINKEYILKRKDIAESWIGSYNYSPIKNEQGEIVGSVVTARDISISKKAEQELIEAKEKAEESDRLKSAFLTNMSHEIRTPMNGIIGFTELLKEPSLTLEEQRDFIQTIQISGERMLNTINSIVDMSKIESGLVKVDINESNINDKIDFTRKFFSREIETKGLELFVKKGLSDKDSIVRTDNEKVYGVLTNLVKNAIKFTYEGSIELGYAKKGEYLEFFVKDTGVGIPKNQYQLIFDRFRQGSESHNRGYEGSGLGLSISKSYVELLGGEIRVESEEGRGSSFYFTIPYNPVSVDKDVIEEKVVTEQKNKELRKLKTLIVEDDEISYSLLLIHAQKFSNEVIHAITGVQAIDACRNNPDIDLVLMDIRMPIMNGLEATQQIRMFNKEIIIIAQTAYGFESDYRLALEAGCNDYISKPINITILYEKIKEHIK
jgi:PAS domain S-box-containing protein